VSVTHFIADPHFFHASPDKADGIIKLAGRPFANGREMNDFMKAGWQASVRDDDAVICLGDFAFERRVPSEDLRALFDALPGRKHLVVGNHDGELTKSLPWDSIWDMAHTVVESSKLVLCHYPMLSWNGSRKPTTLMLYGHHHGKIPGNQQSCDIGVDVLGFAPVRLSVIRRHMATLPPRPPLQGGDLEIEGGPKP
jgi:calcineurin-like phosphoesterase family protein